MNEIIKIEKRSTIDQLIICNLESMSISSLIQLATYKFNNICIINNIDNIIRCRLEEDYYKSDYVELIAEIYKR